MTVYIALLRGINVGGKNKIKMADLREALAAVGLEGVQTYIQSGNVLFSSELGREALQEKVEGTIRDTFGLNIPVIIRSLEELISIAENLPFTKEEIAEAKASAEGECLYAAMLGDQPAPDKIAKLNAMELSGDRFHLDGNQLYLLYRFSVRNSKLSAQVERLGVPTTVRNWNTLNKLIELGKALR